MKIVIFAPHPDDEIIGCGGSILNWIEEGHDVHIIYVTDNRAIISWGLKVNEVIMEDAAEFLNLSEGEIAKIALKEAEDVAKAFGFLNSNVHLLKIHDRDAKNQIDLAISLSKKILENVDRIVIPGYKSAHPDHKATHVIATRAAKELDLKNAEFYVFYMNLRNVPKEKQTKIKTVDYREKLYNIMSLYKTQICTKDTKFGWQTLKRRRSEWFGVFKFEEIKKYLKS